MKEEGQIEGLCDAVVSLLLGPWLNLSLISGLAVGMGHRPACSPQETPGSWQWAAVGEERAV